MARVERHCEIRPQHEIAFFYREFECPHCQGGEYHDDHPWDGVDEWVHCDECGGTGVLYLRDCRPCKFCSTKIYFEKSGEKWVPMNAETDEIHNCKGANQ